MMAEQGTQNFGKITFLRLFRKSVRLKAYPRAVRDVKNRAGRLRFFLFRVLLSGKDLCEPYL